MLAELEAVKKLKDHKEIMDYLDETSTRIHASRDLIAEVILKSAFLSDEMKEEAKLCYDALCEGQYRLAELTGTIENEMKALKKRKTPRS